MSTSDHSVNSGRDCDVLRSPNDLHRLCYPPPEFMHKAETSRESEFYHSKTKMAQSKVDDQRHETIILKKQYNELLADKHRLEQEIDRLQRYHEEDRKEVAELRRQQETLTETGGSETEQMYVSTVRKCEAMKEEYDTLHKRYADLMASHSATVSKLEVTQEEMSCWRKRYEEAMLERNAVIRERNGLQQQCTAAIRQWDNSLRERNEAREQLTKVQQQRDEAMKEINQAMAVRIKATKDLARLTEERNAAIQEYSLIMSERDSVHKEIERLQEELSESQKMIKAFETQKKAALEEVESLRREIASALQDRDHAIKECNDLREKYGDFVTEQDTGKHSQEWSSRKYETCWEIERDGLRKERDLNTPSRDTHLQGRGRLDDLDQANREVENLSRQLERLHIELIEAQQEADVCKRRRDWAFSERDKIVLERESIRTLCDKLRRERDRAVSDLAEALRDSDEVKRQRNEAAKELKELKEKIEAQLEKETRMKQLNSVGNNHSRDSAIDADLQEWEVETFEINLRVLPEDIGFEIGGGKDNSHNGNDSSIFVQNIVKGSNADGKLKVNDCILRINNTDTVNVDRRLALDALKSSEGILNMLIKRRRLTSSRGVQTIMLNLNGGKNHGLILEPGVYVSRITPGSVAAREGSVAVGDRLLSVNGKSVESIQSIRDVQDLIEVSGSMLILQVSKCIPCPNSPPNASNGHNMNQMEKKKTSAEIADDITSKPCAIDLEEKVMTSSSVQTDDIVEHSVNKHNKILSSLQRSRKETGEWTECQSPQPTLLDKAYYKLFGERRHVKDKKSCSSHSPSSLLGNEDPIAELDSVLDYYSKVSSSKSFKSSSRKQDKNGGTWPKYKHRGPHLHYSEAGTLQAYRRRERKSLSTFAQQFNIHDCKTVDEDLSEPKVTRVIEHCNEKERKCPINISDRDHLLYLECQRSSQSSDCSTLTSIPVLSPSVNTTRNSSSGSYTSPDMDTPLKIKCANQNTDQLDYVTPLSYTGNTTTNSYVDYSVVSAHRDKDVLEYYKNRSNKQRPRSAHYVLSDSDCLNSTESSQYKTGLSVTSYSHNNHINLSSSERPLSTRNSGHLYPASAQTSLVVTGMTSQNLFHNSMPFYSLNSSQHGILHPHPHHTHGGSSVCFPTVPSSRYSSPPNFSVYTSRSGDSLLSSSATESILGSDPHPYHSPIDNGRYVVKDSGRYSFASSPCSQYSYSGTSPTQSIELSHFHGLSHSGKRLVPNHSHINANYRDESYCSSGFDGISTFPKRNQRIRIPSNPSVTSKSSAGKVSSSSIEKTSSVSERSSPMPSFTIEWLNSDGTHSELSDYNNHSRIPKPGDLRKIEIDKCSEPLGIQIICGLGGNSVFVSSVHDKSLAAQTGLQVGDQLLEICGINMRNATYCLAANVLRQCGDNISILVQYNPDKFQEIPETDSSSAEISPTNTPAVSLTSCNITAANVSTEEISGSTSSTLTKPKANPMHIHSIEKEDIHQDSSSVPRLVILKKTTSNLGISLLGGNAVGIFVHSVQEDSPACGSSGLRPGDQILEYNGVNLRNATAEEAAYELAKPSEKITILAEHNVERYTDIQNKAGDSFYIRALCDRPSIDGSLTFHKDDILFIDNTMYNGVPGLWQAWLVDQEGQKVKCGYIPSKYKMEEELLMKCSLGDLDGDGSRRGSTTARRSFFRRKRHQRSNSHDSKELASFSDMSINSCSDSGIHGEELLPLTYQRVERLDYLTLRPVIVVGPLMEAVVDKLEQDFPHMFQHCIPEVMRGSQQMMEKSLQELKLIDYRKRGNHFECTTVSAVKEICDKNCHAILDVSLSAVECLQRCQIYPIVIFLKFRSVKQIREVKDPRYLTEKISTKAAKEMYEHTLKIESEYKHIINAVIPGSNLAYMCTQIKTCVEDEQSKTLWVPCGSL